VDCLGSNKKKDSKLKYFFNWNKKLIEPLKSSIDLASKIAIIIWHLITNDRYTKIEQV
jgi:hypothetical protein